MKDFYHQQSIIIFVTLCQIASICCMCPPSTIQGMDSNTCYKPSKIPKSFDDAEADCTEHKQGHLASILRLLNDYYNEQGFYWIGGYQTGTTWNWTDKSPFVYTNWDKGQPSINGSCLSINSDSNSGKWSSLNCDVKQNYFCKIKSTNDNFSTKTPEILTTSKPLIVNECESGWTFYNITNKCYKVFHGQTCNESEATCVQNGGHLASIHSLEENVFISELAQAGYTFGNDDYWGRYHVLIGLMDPTLNGNFYWTDRSPYDYQRWGTCDEQPYLPDGCTTLVADQDTGGCFQEWITNSEETVHRAFVCQKSSIAHICQN